MRSCCEAHGVLERKDDRCDELERIKGLGTKVGDKRWVRLEHHGHDGGEDEAQVEVVEPDSLIIVGGEEGVEVRREGAVSDVLGWGRLALLAARLDAATGPLLPGEGIRFERKRRMRLGQERSSGGVEGG